MLGVYGVNCPSKPMVYKWIERFADGYDTVEELKRTGRPVSSTTKGNVDLVLKTMDQDRRITVRQLEEVLGIPKTFIHTIVTEHLSMTRIVARWVPKLLSDVQKNQRKSVCKDLLRRCKREKDFLNQIVIGDESWFHFYEPESKFQSSQWKRLGEPVPIKAKSTPSAGKRMSTVFWDRDGILLIDWLP